MISSENPHLNFVPYLAVVFNVRPLFTFPNYYFGKSTSKRRNLQTFLQFNCGKPGLARYRILPVDVALYKFDWQVKTSGV